MTLILNNGTRPNGLEVHFGFSPDVEIGDVDLPLKDFLFLASKVLTGTDLMSVNDPRLDFVQSVSLFHEGSGFNNGGCRLTPLSGLRFSDERDRESRFVDVGNGYFLSLRDFLVTAFYVLTNSDLEINDPRPRFVQHVKFMSALEVNGGKRLVSTFDLVFPGSAQSSIGN